MYFVTVFEDFKNFAKSAAALEKLLEITPNLLFRTERISEHVRAVGKRRYWGFDYGCHIGFFWVRPYDI